MSTANKIQEVLSQEVLQKAVVENYESLYAIDINTSNYFCFHQSDSFSTLKLENEGTDFFEDVGINIITTIYREDRSYVQSKLSRASIIDGLSKNSYYSFVYRLMIDGKPLYHKLRAVKESVDGQEYILIGIRNVDTAFRQDKSQAETLSSMQQREKNHLEAILASSAGYLEANLTQDRVLEISPYALSREVSNENVFHYSGIPSSFDELEKWISENLVIENRKKYIEISNCDYLISCFKRGEKRASVSFSSKYADEQTVPCKKVFYLYQDDASEDILSFCVIYDLTEQQRKEKELEDLEKELQMSRIRNFSSQMQPHFLYNALGSIQEIVLDDPEYASELIGDFTVHLRSCIRAMADDSLIPFEKELENIRAYVNIEKMRLGEKLQVIYDIGVSDFSILPLTIQPIVENAIRHGVYKRGKEGGKVILRTQDFPTFRKIIVEDTGIGFDADFLLSDNNRDQTESTGLKNLIFRLDKVMHANISIHSIIGTGTTVEITIPKSH